MLGISIIPNIVLLFKSTFLLLSILLEEYNLDMINHNIENIIESENNCNNSDENENSINNE